MSDKELQERAYPIIEKVRHRKYASHPDEAIADIQLLVSDAIAADRKGRATDEDLRERIVDVFENQAPLVCEYSGHDRWTNEYVADGGWDGAMLYEYADQVLTLTAQASNARLADFATGLKDRFYDVGYDSVQQTIDTFLSQYLGEE